MTTDEAFVAGHGRVVGAREHGVLRFSAIPFAEPPVGELRWRAPRPARWSGKRDATLPGPIAPQLPSRLSGAMGSVELPQSEDCLHLTVWTPAVDQRLRPVVVWLHGGAWQSGAGALDWYSGARLASHGDLVVVAPNYRLGMLGWLYVPGQTANVGLLDQEAAIAWVMDHIAEFGGDPSRVTLMGQSAGAMAAVCMLVRQPRLDRLILQSTPLGRGIRRPEQAEALSIALLHALGVSDLDAARKLPVQALLQAQQDAGVAQALAHENEMRSLFGPVADGAVLPGDIDAGLMAAASHADVLIGYTNDEMRAFSNMQDNPASAAIGDALFGAPSRQWARAAIAGGRGGWLYRFDHAPAPQFGACHCIELPFVFGTLDAFVGAPMLDGLQPANGSRLCREIQAAWTAFIRREAPPWDPAPVIQVFC